MKRMRVRKRKNRLIIKIILVIFIFSFSFFFSIKYFYGKVDNEMFLKYLLENQSSYIEIDNSNLFKNTIKNIIDIDFTPSSLLKTNYVLNKIDTSSDEDKDISNISNYVKDPYKVKEVNNPIVYLYNTHQSEEYAYNHLESYNVKPTVMMTSYILREKLNKNNIPTIVEEGDITEFLKTNNWNYASSYKVSKLLMSDAKEKNESLKYFIDLHRDSVSKSIATTVINGKKYAKILFIVGLENSNYKDNLLITEKINNLFNEKYPTLSRGIYKKQGPLVNGVYNQDFSPNTILIEVGSETNTIDEVYNTTEAISVVLTEYIKGDMNE